MIRFTHQPTPIGEQMATITVCRNSLETAQEAASHFAKVSGMVVGEVYETTHLIKNSRRGSNGEWNWYPQYRCFGRQVPSFRFEATHPALAGDVCLHTEGLYLTSGSMHMIRTTTGKTTVPHWERLLTFDGEVIDKTRHSI